MSDETSGTTPPKPSSYEITRRDNYVLVELNEKLSFDSVSAFEHDLPKFLEAPILPVIVDCEKHSELPMQWVRVLARLSQQMRSSNLGVRLACSKSELQLQIRQNGLDHSLPVKPTIHSAMVDLGLASARQLDVNFINPFIVATARVLEIQAHVKSRTGALFRRAAHEHFGGDISGVIGLVSEAFTGSVVISFPENTFLKVMSNMLGETHTEVTQDITDGAGELTNIIFGQAKIILNDRGYGIKTAIPSVVTGKDHSVHNLSTGPRVVIPFESDAGPFFIEICLSE